MQGPRSSDGSVPVRQVRAVFDDRTITVYQAYSAAIAKPAVAANRFVPPFKPGRMTWIKPSFLWMMYRCGWAEKADQERVLAVDITREGFEWALAHSSLSHYDPALYASHAEWAARKESTPVRIQWDPERSLHLDPLGHRAIQIGLGGEASRLYVNEWTVRITDVTDLAHSVRDLVRVGHEKAAVTRLPIELPYPLSVDIGAVIGAS